MCTNTVDTSSLFFSYVNCSTFNVTDIDGYFLYQCEGKVVRHYDRQVSRFSISGNSIVSILEYVTDRFAKIALTYNEKRYPFCLKSVAHHFAKPDCDEIEVWEIESEDKSCPINCSIEIQDFFTVMKLSIKKGEKIFRYSDDAGTLSLFIDDKWEIVMCSESKLNPFHIFSIVAHQMLRGDL